MLRKSNTQFQMTSGGIESFTLRARREKKKNHKELGNCYLVERMSPKRGLPPEEFCAADTGQKDPLEGGFGEEHWGQARIWSLRQRATERGLLPAS